MGKKEGKGTKFKIWFKAPFRWLIKARDYYVRTMLDCSAHFERCGGTTGLYAAGQFSIVPNSFSFHSSRNSTQNEELMELLRAASARNPSNRVDQPKILPQSPCVKSPAAGRCGARRRARVGIETIEEERSCEFGEDATVETRNG